MTVEVESVGPGKWRVRSSNGEDWYDVYRSGDAWACSCRGWTFRQRRYPEFKCKHIQAAFARTVARIPEARA